MIEQLGKDDQEDLVDAVENLKNRLDNDHGNSANPTDVGDIDILVTVNFNSISEDDVEEIRKDLIDQDIVEIDGGSGDKNAQVNEVNPGELKDQIGYEEQIDHTQYFDGNSLLKSKLADDIQEEHQFKYVAEEDEDHLYVLEDGIWKEYGPSTVKEQVRKRIEPQWADRHYRETRKLIEARTQVRKENFKPPTDKIPFENGVYDLENNELVEYKPEFNFTFKYEVPYDPELENDDVDEFLNTIQDTDEKIKKLKEIAGLTLLPDVPIDKAPILFGKGANGKNQYVKIIRKILGEGNAHELSNSDISDDKHATAELEGKQMVFYDEFEDVSNPGKLKSMLGGDRMRVRPMRTEGYTIKNTAFAIFAANELPRTSDQSKGFFRRWEIIDFPYEFTKNPDDGHKDLIPERELEKRYMNDEALAAFATEAVDHLKDVLEDSTLTAEQSTEETRQRWNEKSSPIYSFLDKYVKSGEKPDPGATGECDWIIKEDLRDFINAYTKELNSGKVETHQVTRALQSHPDLDPETDYQPQLENGRQPRAYAGLQFTKAFCHDIHLSPHLSELFSEASKYIESMVGQMVNIAKNEKMAEVLQFLNSREKPRAKLFELVKALDLEHEDMEDIEESEFIEREASESDSGMYPVYVLDEDRVEEAIEEAGLIKDEEDRIRGPQSWVQDQIDEISQDTWLTEADLIQDGVDKGFSEDKVEEAIQGLKNAGEIYEPKPGKIAKM